MKFIDEVKICVEAGAGGKGASSFLRLKFMPFGGPDGGNGGDGGSVLLFADDSVNTLVDYCYIQAYRAQNGRGGSGRHCTGKSGEDLVLRVPVGTIVYDDDTGELIADLAQIGQLACVAQGGRHGIGNARFKSSTNRAPRRVIPGQPGEKRHLRLELRVLADVGLVGLPNAGKSTLIGAMSAARPKVADYPFTTLYPHLGVVKVAQFRSFVMADLPGLIMGAAEGAGLGTRFLKHVTRTHLLLHVVEVMPADGSDPADHVRAITRELGKFNSDLLMKERWLVLNKADQLASDIAKQHCDAITQSLGWTGKVFIVSGLDKQGLGNLSQQIMSYLEKKEHHLN